MIPLHPVALAARGTAQVPNPPLRRGFSCALHKFISQIIAYQFELCCECGDCGHTPVGPLRADNLQKRPSWQGRFFYCRRCVAGPLLDCWLLPPVLNRAVLQSPIPRSPCRARGSRPRRGPPSLRPDLERPPDHRGDHIIAHQAGVLVGQWGMAATPRQIHVNMYARYSSN